MWPDAADPDAAGVVGRGPVEKYAIAPHWLVASFSARGVKGYWGQHPGQPVQQVRGNGRRECVKCVLDAGSG